MNYCLLLATRKRLEISSIPGDKLPEISKDCATLIIFIYHVFTNNMATVWTADKVDELYETKPCLYSLLQQRQMPGV